MAIAPQAMKANVTGKAVDVSGGYAATIVISAGAYKDGAITFTLMECDTADGTFTTVAAADIYDGSIPGIATGDAERVIVAGYKGYKKFIRLDAKGTSTLGTDVGAVVLLGYPHRQPV